MTTLEKEGEQGPAQAWEVRVTEEDNRTGKGPREGKETGSQPRCLAGVGGGWGRGTGSGVRIKGGENLLETESKKIRLGTPGQQSSVEKCD